MSEKNVPNIRFKGFTEDWEQRKLESTADEFKSGFNIASEKINNSGKYPVFGGNGIRGYTDSFNHDGEYALIGRQGALSGNMNFSKGKAYFTEHAVAVKANQSNDTKFLLYLMLKMKLARWMTQSAQPGLSVNVIKNISVQLPTKEEQLKIRNLLSFVDQLVASNQRKLDQLKEVKKILMQKIFDQEWRFKGFADPWEQRKLGEHAIIKGRLGWKSLKQDEYTKTGPSMIAGKHIQNGIIDWQNVDHIPQWRYDESPEIMLRNNDIIFSKDGSLGNPALIKELKQKATINSTMMLVRLNDIDASFFYQVMVGPSFERLVYLKVSGSSIPHLFQADMTKFVFKTPGIDEQTDIGMLLNKIDALIASNQQKVNQLKKMKKWFMQNMFV